MGGNEGAIPTAAHIGLFVICRFAKNKPCYVTFVTNICD